MKSNLVKILLPTAGLGALGRLKNQCLHFFSVSIDPILSKLACDKDMHYILDEFEFRPDWTTDYRIICP